MPTEALTIVKLHNFVTLKCCITWKILETWKYEYLFLYRSCDFLKLIDFIYRHYDMTKMRAFCFLSVFLNKPF